MNDSRPVNDDDAADASGADDNSDDDNAHTPGVEGVAGSAESAGSNRLRSGPRLLGRADLVSALGRLVWRRRDARIQRRAGEASARHAVKLEPGAEPGPPLADYDRSAGSGTALADRDATDATLTEPFEPDPQVAAFFDVDNTLIQGASIILLARGLAKHRFFTARDVAGLAWSQAKFRISGEENADDVAAGRDKALSFVAGRTVAELTELSEEVVDTSMLDRVWPGTRSLVQMHLDAGQQVWLVTATPVMLARVIATRLGLSGALGTVAEEEYGVYTGRLVGDILHGPGKAHAISRLAEAEGFDLSRCYAYSDSFNDMPMLTLVGNPVAINPDSKLRKYASENGWDVKDFRTVRKAAKRAMPGVLAVGGLAGARVAARSTYGSRALDRARRIF
ncbi:HAD family phosphatase [Dietzia sp. B32]|uniref:HAD family hydrolase n=1 Tax=Dietzia sp. B32 TaxID=2915130 RepID=UPI0021ADC5E5|nr:HAD-IB family hydrolase [Dietzia sp. B32]UVE96529.1 HAD-IB family hydrolase [Dietzia sp. B32]